jgi:zinc/manganese transport system ATP-binding protein
MALAAKPRSTTALNVAGVSVQLGGRQILDQITFELRAGELTGLIGSNGAGKTTLFRVILGLQAVTSGAVQVGAQGGQQAVGYVPQKFLLDPDMPLRGRDLVGLGIDGHRFGLPRPSKSRRSRIQEMLEAVDAQGFADARVGQLSGGEQQRILIAHALISRPQLLLLDEPLANLDLRSAREVVSLLSRVATEQGVSVLISAHEMNPLLPVMDRIVYLADGRAVAGTAEQVIRTDVLSKLYRHHVDVLKVHGRVIVVAGEGDHDDTPDHGPVEII